MKNVLMLAHADQDQESRLQVALDLTRALGGHLTCLNVMMAPAFVSDYSTGAGEEAMLVQSIERETANADMLRERLEREDVSWDIRDDYGELGYALREASALADVIVVSSPGDSEDPEDPAASSPVTGFVAAKSNRLVVAVPPGCNRLDPRGKALVAWDGTREADDAVRAALPLLQMAASVTLFQLNADQGDFSAEEAATYLSRHGVHPDIVARETDGPISDTVLERARQLGADYVVMGAFGHARAVEAIFGGVSRAMLHKSELPLILAH
jgi:nucleotide-binding universal stress UspA family protein